MSGQIAEAAAAASKLEEVVYNRTENKFTFDPSNPAVGGRNESRQGSVCQPNSVVGGKRVWLGMKPCRCQCRTCPRCGPRMAWEMRFGLQVKVGSIFKKMALLTLTVDRNEFPTPEAAHRFISDKGRIRLLLRHLGIEHFFWVLEFQQKTGDGWPHWHILIDLADCPGGKVDLKAAWQFWRDKWHLGGLQLSLRREFDDPAHAVNYITKYLTKQPGKGYPRWVLESEKRIRFFQGSRSLGALVGHGGNKKSESTGKDRRCRAPMRPLVERMAACGQKSNVLVQTLEPGDQEPSCQFVGTIGAAPGPLLVLFESGKIDAGLVVQRVRIERPDRVVDAVEPCVLLGGVEDSQRAFDRLQRALWMTGEPTRTEERIEARRVEILKRASQYGQPASEVRCE